MKALYDRVLVKKLEGATKSKGGIILPYAVRDNSILAEVLAVGSGFITNSGAVVPLTLKVGDKVLLAKGTGTTVTVDGDEVLVIWEREVLVVL